MATGDLKGSLKKLQTSLRYLKYPREVDYNRLAKGDPFSCLPIVSYAFTSFSSAVAEHLVEQGIELTGKNDLSFIETVYKVLRDFFSYKPLLTKQQFLQSGFAERKAGLLCDIIGFVMEKHKKLTKGSKVVSPPKRRLLSRSDSKTAESPPLRETCHRVPAHTAVVSSRPLVERHMGCSTPTQFSLSSDDSLRMKEEEEKEDLRRKDSCDSSSPRPSAHTACVSESTLRAVEAGLQDCVSRLGQQLTLLDSRLQDLEKSMAGKITMELSDWENLQSRVLLLETSLALTSSSAQDCPAAGGGVGLSASVEKSSFTQESVMDLSKAPVSRSSMMMRSLSESNSSSYTSTALPPSTSEENIKERLERIASMMKNTSSLLKDVEPTI
ncbi:centrosomal protein of 44 kDa [Astyanax mexicanus]|uniref:centrosomal protein of 44 kDa n=1 Tax=Astyanax mexicanus TaxID=7994 RepID=UPI0020CB0DE9|nr:centrosomal protein of 44 kDa [Astyanax mexicanus]